MIQPRIRSWNIQHLRLYSGSELALFLLLFNYASLVTFSYTLLFEFVGFVQDIFLGLLWAAPHPTPRLPWKTTWFGEITIVRKCCLFTVMFVGK